MPAGNQCDTVTWTGGTPVSTRFDDPYFSLADGLAETRHVFLAGNGLPARFRDGFHIAELGFGTGLNLVATVLAWGAAGPLLSAWDAGARGFAFGPADVTVITGDARETLPAWPGRADAWLLDGFSPAKNPELWSEAMMAEVARHTAPGGSFATYTAAGHVRRALASAGFEVERASGHGGKRHMSRGTLKGTT
jgi:tRNA U34 5-methylaminomethyl-2-thiouridine-forming methyltransferase MnmC